MSQSATRDVTRLSKKLDENMSMIDSQLAIDKSFDLIKRKFVVGERNIAFYYVDTFNKNSVTALIQHHLGQLSPDALSANAFEEMLYHDLNFAEVDKIEYLEDVIRKVLSGPMVMLIDGSEKAISVDVRTYPARSPQEPDLEKVIRGPRDGFVETLPFNAELIRRRLRDPNLRVEYMMLGYRSKMDVAVSYIEDIANPELVESVKKRLKEINIDGLPMAEVAIKELITPGTHWNPYPKIRYTERPDVATSHLLDGHVLIMVDTSPSVIILPATFFHHVQHAEEYRESPSIGVYLRWIRILGIFLSIFLVPAWLMFAMNPELLPPVLDFIGPKKSVSVPIFIQFILAELAVDLVRMSTIHTPSALATALGIIATLLIGEMAVNVGLFNAEVIMYTAAAAIGQFLTPSWELSMANRITRFILLLAVGFFGLPGFIIVSVTFIIWLAFNKSFGVPYLWPFVPFDLTGIHSVLIRTPVAQNNTRFSVLKPRDNDRQRKKRKVKVPSPARKPEASKINSRRKRLRRR
ncbi:MAG: spore germination protein [Clostridiales bacterium]|nr:spore germination protein [Clostridiales bacterium]MCF8021235.1 spore germination protein [Clostridiales bacterium]